MTKIEGASMQPNRRSFLLQSLAVAGLAAAPRGAGALEVNFFRIGTGSTSGTYFPIGSLIASAISNPPGSRDCARGGSCGVPGLIAVVQSTQGSVDNVEAIESGALESGFSQADVAYWAFNGAGPYKENPPLTRLRAIANLYPESLQLVVRADSGIHTVSDLKGKRISLDREESGTLVDAKLVLAAWGIKPKQFKAVNVAPGNAAEMVRLNELDGFFIVAGTPTGGVRDLARDVPLRLVPIDGPKAASLIDHYPFFARNVIPAGTYHSVGITETLSVGAQWLCSSGLPEELVYGVTQALWHPNTRQLLDTGHPKGQYITFDTALNGLGVPLHAGARRYYEERGVVLLDLPEPPDPAAQ